MNPRHRRTFSILAALALVSLLTGCVAHQPAPTTPVAKIGHYGGRIMEGINIAQKTVANFEAQGLVPTEATAKFMIAAYESGKSAETLANLLILYDAMGGGYQPVLMAQAGKILDDLRAQLKRMTGLSFGTPTNTIVSLVENVVTIVIQVQAIVTAVLNKGEPESTAIGPADLWVQPAVLALSN